MEKEAQKYEGKAYAFFDCNASKEQIEAELPKIRECVKAPNKLELQLMEAADNSDISSPGRSALCSILKSAKEAGMKYFLKAKSTVKQVADEVAAVINQAYQSPLYAYNEEFRGEIVYQDMGKYIFRE